MPQSFQETQTPESVLTLARFLGREHGLWLASPSLSLLAALLTGKSRPGRIFLSSDAPAFVSNIAKFSGATPVAFPLSEPSGVRDLQQALLDLPPLGRPSWGVVVHQNGETRGEEALRVFAQAAVPSIEICLGSLDAVSRRGKSPSVATIVGMDQEPGLQGAQLAALLSDDAQVVARVKKFCLPGPDARNYVLDASPRGLATDEAGLASVVSDLIARVETSRARNPSTGASSLVQTFRRFLFDEQPPASPEPSSMAPFQSFVGPSVFARVQSAEERIRTEKALAESLRSRLDTAEQEARAARERAAQLESELRLGATDAQRRNLDLQAQLRQEHERALAEHAQTIAALEQKNQRLENELQLSASRLQVAEEKHRSHVDEASSREAASIEFQKTQVSEIARLVAGEAQWKTKLEQEASHHARTLQEQEARHAEALEKVRSDLERQRAELRAATERHATEAAGLSAKLETVEARKAELETEIQRTTALIQSRNDDLIRLTTEAEELRAKAAEATKGVQAIQAELETVRDGARQAIERNVSAAAEQRDYIEKAEKKRAEIEAARDAALSAKAEAEAEITKLKAAAAEWRTKTALLTKEQVERDARQSQTLEKLRAETEKLQTAARKAAEAKESAVATLTKRLSALSTAKEAVDQEHAAARAQVDRHRTDFAELKSRFDVLEAEKAKSEAELGSTKATLEARETDLKGLQERLSAAETQNEKTRTERDDLVKKLETETQNVERLRANADALRAEIDRIEEKQHDAEKARDAQISAALEKHKELDAARAALEAEVENLRARETALRKEIARNDDAAASGTEEVLSLRSRLKEFEKRADESPLAVAELKKSHAKEITSLSAALADWSTRADVARKEAAEKDERHAHALERLRNELERLREEGKAAAEKRALEVGDLKARLEATDRKRREAERERDAAKSAFEASSAGGNTALVELQGKIVALQAERESAEKSYFTAIETWRAKVESAEQTAKDLRAALDARSAEIQGHSKESAAWAKERTSLEGRISDLFKGRSTDTSRIPSLFKDRSESPHGEPAAPVGARDITALREAFERSEAEESKLERNLPRIPGPWEARAPQATGELTDFSKSVSFASATDDKADALPPAIKVAFKPDYDKNPAKDRSVEEEGRGWLAGWTSKK